MEREHVDERAGAGAVREDASGLSRPKPRSGKRWVVVLTIVVVSLIVASVIVYYVLIVLFTGFGSSPPLVDPVLPMQHYLLEDGFDCILGECIANDAVLTWSDFTIELTDGRDHAAWNTSAQDLDSGTMTRYNYGLSSLGTLTVFLNVTDVAGNGVIDQRDKLEITAGGGEFTDDDIYLVRIIWKATDGVVSEEVVIW